MIQSSKSRDWALGYTGIVILLITALLRIAGIDHGMPFWLVNDELPLVGGALRMIELKTLVPTLEPRLAILYYPPGLPYLYLVLFAPVIAIWWLAGGFPSALAFGDAVLSNMAPLWLVARAASVAFAVATAYVIMRLTGEVWRDRRVALLAGLVFAVSFHHGLLGHFARVWPATTFFYWLGIWASWKVLTAGSRRAYAASAIAAGAGFAVNYIGVLSAVSTGVAHLVRNRRVTLDRQIMIFASIVIGFVVIFAALHWQNFLRLMGYSAILEAVPGMMPGPNVPQPPLPHGHNVGWLEGLADFLRAFWRNEPAVMLLGAAGLPLIAVRQPRFLLIAAPALLLHLGVFATGFVREDRYILPITILFMISAAGLVVRLARDSTVMLVVGAAALTGISLLTSLQLDRLLLRPDARQIAREWILLHAGEDEGVVNLMPRVPFEPTADSIRDQSQLIGAESVTYLQQRQIAGGNVLSGGGGRKIATVNLVTQSDSWLRNRSVPELYDELMRRRYRWVPLSADVAAEGRHGFVDLLRARGRLVQVIDPGAEDAPQPNQWPIPQARLSSLFRISHFGPRVEIWRMD